MQAPPHRDHRADLPTLNGENRGGRHHGFDVRTCWCPLHSPLSEQEWPGIGHPGAATERYERRREHGESRAGIALL